jgi:hypothetical protein
VKKYLETDEFVTSYTEGLRAFLLNSFPEGQTAHIEDLMAWSATYADSVFQFVSNLPRTAPCKCELEPKKKKS